VERSARRKAILNFPANACYRCVFLPSYPGHRRFCNEEWIVLTRLNLDILTGRPLPTIYSAEFLINPFYNATTLTYYVLDQTNGEKLFGLPVPVSGSGLGIVYEDLSRAEYYQWSTDLYFNSNTGLPEICLAYHVPFEDGLASHELLAYTDVYTVNEFLLSMLSSSKERLALSFHNPTGTLIGVSHGKSFSHR